MLSSLKILPLSFLFAVTLLFSGCSNNSEEDVNLICVDSDLSFEVIDVVSAGCTDPGGFVVDASGGTSPYEYSLDGLNFSSQASFSNLSAGDFSITVRDDAGCTFSSDFTLPSDGSSISLNFSVSNSGCLNSDGEIVVNAAGGSGELTYRLDGGNIQSSGIFSSLAPGVYAVEVTDAEGCSAIANAQVFTNTSLGGDIMPIINADCAISGCHNGSVSPNLTTAAAVVGNAARIKSETQSGSMPRGRSLSQAEIDLIACWVDDGAKDN